MKWKANWISWAVLITVSSNLLAGGNAAQKRLNLHRSWPRAIGKMCCDDYDCKPLPTSRPWCCFQCDDYCSKPLPYAVGVCRFCCDDYCGKPMPKVSPPPCDLKCIPNRLPCGTCQPRLPTATSVPPSTRYPAPNPSVFSLQAPKSAALPPEPLPKR